MGSAAMAEPEVAVLFDTEFMTVEGALGRGWFGPGDPDPVAVQIGAVRLSLSGEVAVGETVRLHVLPRGRDGAPVAVDPYLTALTGITAETVAAEGRPLAEALDALARFADGAPLWSWGKDELYLIAVSCFVAGIAPPLPASRFGNVRALMLKAGMPAEDVARTGSGGLAGYFGVAEAPLVRHDALDDALSLAWAARHLLRTGRLAPGDFARP